MVRVGLRGRGAEPVRGGDPVDVALPGLNDVNNVRQAEGLAIRTLDHASKAGVKPSPRTLEDIHQRRLHDPGVADNYFKLWIFHNFFIFSAISRDLHAGLKPLKPHILPMLGFAKRSLGTEPNSLSEFFDFQDGLFGIPDEPENEGFQFGTLIDQKQFAESVVLGPKIKPHPLD